MMDFYAVLDQVLSPAPPARARVLSGTEGPVHLDDEQLDALKEELLYAHRGLLKRMGRVLCGQLERVPRQHPP